METRVTKWGNDLALRIRNPLPISLVSNSIRLSKCHCEETLWSSHPFHLPV